VEGFLSLVKADKNEVTLKPGASDQVVITNGTPGLILIDIVKRLPGVDAKLQGPAVPSGVKDVLTIQAGQQPVNGTIELWVKPIGPRISIKVTVQP
jgi:hypothetical protein